MNPILGSLHSYQGIKYKTMSAPNQKVKDVIWRERSLGLQLDSVHLAYLQIWCISSLRATMAKFNASLGLLDQATLSYIKHDTTSLRQQIVSKNISRESYCWLHRLLIKEDAINAMDIQIFQENYGWLPEKANQLWREMLGLVSTHTPFDLNQYSNRAACQLNERNRIVLPLWKIRHPLQIHANQTVLDHTWVMRPNLCMSPNINQIIQWILRKPLND